MDSSLELIKKNLEKCNIYVLDNWLKEKYEIHKEILNNVSLIEKKIISDISSTDIDLFIDKRRVSLFQEKLSFNLKQSIVKENVFCQIQAIANIGDVSHKQQGNLDEIEKINNKYLRTDEEEERNKKMEKEKVVLKFQLTNGVETFFGFEYEKIPLIHNIQFEKYQKVVIGEQIEVRRGIFYFKPSNFTLFK